MSNKNYVKSKLLESLEALRIATVKGIFTESERREVVEDLISYSLSENVKAMLTGRKGILHESGELAVIMDFFAKEEELC